MLKIKELENKLHYQFQNISLLQQAITHRSCSQAHYERMEFVGDGILNYVIALNLYLIYNELSEGELSRMRAKLVNQTSLWDLALELSLGEYLFLGKGEVKSGGKDRISILADCMEAIFAAINFDGGFEAAKLVIENLFYSKLHAADLLCNIKDYKSILQEYTQKQKLALPSYQIVAQHGPEHNLIFRMECEIKQLNLKVETKAKDKKIASQLAAQQMLNLIMKKNNGK